MVRFWHMGELAFLVHDYYCLRCCRRGLLGQVILQTGQKPDLEFLAVCGILSFKSISKSNWPSAKMTCSDMVAAWLIMTWPLSSRILMDNEGTSISFLVRFINIPDNLGFREYHQKFPSDQRQGKILVEKKPWSRDPFSPRFKKNLEVFGK